MGVYAIYFKKNTSHKNFNVLPGPGHDQVADMCRSFRNACVEFFIRSPASLGGPGIIYQIDESLYFHKQKYHRGRTSEHQVQVFGIVNASYIPVRGYIEVVAQRDKASLLYTIQRICLPGTIIYSDKWAAYRDITGLGFQYYTVNHSLNFVNPDNGVHTQHIESYWNKNKIYIKKMKGAKKEDLNSYLDEYMWRERFRNNEFYKILECLTEVNKND